MQTGIKKQGLNHACNCTEVKEDPVQTQRPGPYFTVGVRDPTCRAQLLLIFVLWDEDMNELGLSKHLIHNRAL